MLVIQGNSKHRGYRYPAENPGKCLLFDNRCMYLKQKVHRYLVIAVISLSSSSLNDNNAPDFMNFYEKDYLCPLSFGKITMPF